MQSLPRAIVRMPAVYAAVAIALTLITICGYLYYKNRKVMLRSLLPPFRSLSRVCIDSPLTLHRVTVTLPELSPDGCLR